MGPAVDSSQKLLKKMKRGYICLADSVVDEINKNNTHFIQDISTKKEGDMFDTARNETQAVHSVCLFYLFFIPLLFFSISLPFPRFLFLQLKRFQSIPFLKEIM